MDEFFEKYRREIWVCLLLAAAVWFIYAPVCRYGFVDLDDYANVLMNKYVKTGLTADSVRWALTTHEDYWRPLTRLSHLLDVECFGMNAGAHHRTNVLLHIANTLLLFILLRQMTGSFWRSAFVAAMFALHPLQVESVAWVTERKDVLSALFWMLTLWAYARYAQCGMRDTGCGIRDAGRVSCPQRAASKEKARAAAGPPKKICPAGGFSPFLSFPGPFSSPWYLVTLLLFALGLSAKPMLITLPFVLLLLDWWPLRRMMRTSEAGSQKSEGADRKPFTICWKLLAEKLPFFVLAGGAAAAIFFAQKSEDAIQEASPWLRIAVPPVAYITYIGRLLRPVHLAAIYPLIKSVPVWQAAGALLPLLIITAGALRSARRYPFLFTGWFWFVGTLLPVSGIIPVGCASTADRFTYLPMVGFWICTVWGAAALPLPDRSRNRIFATAAVLALAACGWVSARQIPVWKDTVTLFEHTLATGRESTVAYNNLGNALVQRKRPDDAVKCYRGAIRVDPDCEEAHNNLANLLFNAGRPDEAVSHLKEVVRVNPAHATAHNNLGVALSNAGRIGEALEHARAAVDLEPDNAMMRANLERVVAAEHAKAGRFDEAVKVAERAAELARAGGDEDLARMLKSQAEVYRQRLPPAR